MKFKEQFYIGEVLHSLEILKNKRFRDHYPKNMLLLILPEKGERNNTNDFSTFSSELYFFREKLGFPLLDLGFGVGVLFRTWLGCLGISFRVSTSDFWNYTFCSLYFYVVEVKDFLSRLIS